MEGELVYDLLYKLEDELDRVKGMIQKENRNPSLWYDIDFGMNNAESLNKRFRSDFFQVESEVQSTFNTFYYEEFGINHDQESEVLRRLNVKTTDLTYKIIDPGYNNDTVRVSTQKFSMWKYTNSTFNIASNNDKLFHNVLSVMKIQQGSVLDIILPPQFHSVELRDPEKWFNTELRKHLPFSPECSNLEQINVVNVMGSEVWFSELHKIWGFIQENFEFVYMEEIGHYPREQIIMVERLKTTMNNNYYALLDSTKSNTKGIPANQCTKYLYYSHQERIVANNKKIFDAYRIIAAKYYRKNTLPSIEAIPTSQSFFVTAKPTPDPKPHTEPSSDTSPISLSYNTTPCLSSSPPISSSPCILPLPNKSPSHNTSVLIKPPLSNPIIKPPMTIIKPPMTNQIIKPIMPVSGIQGIKPVSSVSTGTKILSLNIGAAHTQPLSLHIQRPPETKLTMNMLPETSTSQSNTTDDDAPKYGIVSFNLVSQDATLSSNLNPAKQTTITPNTDLPINLPDPLSIDTNHILINNYNISNTEPNRLDHPNEPIDNPAISNIPLNNVSIDDCTTLNTDMSTTSVTLNTDPNHVPIDHSTMLKTDMSTTSIRLSVHSDQNPIDIPVTPNNDSVITLSLNKKQVETPIKLSLNKKQKPINLMLINMNTMIPIDTSV